MIIIGRLSTYILYTSLWKTIGNILIDPIYDNVSLYRKFFNLWDYSPVSVVVGRKHSMLFHIVHTNYTHLLFYEDIYY